MNQSAPKQATNVALPSTANNALLMAFVVLPAVVLGVIIHAYQPQGITWHLSWVPSLDINLSFRLDGLSFLFASLICAVGTLIQVYAYSYLKGSTSRFSFHLYLTLFMLAMLGLVTADNILLLFVFWELTTLTSYLLIGFNHEKSGARKNALQSLIVTGSGGLALLAGLILLGEMAGSYEISAILASRDAIASHPRFEASLILILAGAFTKSAQFPFHFWLPNAMAAPTPVSAYLHSATMVKAGVFLLARLAPVYVHSEHWFYSLTLFGAVTALWCALLSLKQTDLKLMLAYSTNVVLGILVMLIGIGSELAITAMLLFVLAHSFYKASLFMVVGIIDKACGTREITKLGGIKTILGLTYFAALLAAFSKAGLPPLMGFLGKEYGYKAGLDVSPWLIAILVLVNVLMVALAIALIRAPFFGSARDSHPIPNNASKVDKQGGLWMPPMLLAVGGLVMPLFALDVVNSAIIVPGVDAVMGSGSGNAQDVKLWQGINAPLILSAITVALGVCLYLVYPWLLRTWNSKIPKFVKAEAVFDKMIEAMMSFARWQTRLLQQRKLSRYVLISFATLGLLLCVVGINLLPSGISRISELTSTDLYEAGVGLLLVATALVCTLSRSRLLAILALGVIGFLTTLVFMLYSAPDVAKTLLLVETLMVVFVALLIRRMPALDRVPQHSLPRRTLHAVLAIVIGLAVSVILLTITATPLDKTVSDFFATNSVPGGYGRNIVNVILVDFRAFDTLGEVVVVVIASVAAISTLKTHYHKRNRINSLIFNITAHIVAALMLVFSLYLLLRGHNEPGGGFIGALIAIIGFALLMFAESPNYVRERLYFPPLGIALIGIGLSLLAGLMALVIGLPFLTGLWWKAILPLGTPLLFDVGIYLAVIGGVMGMLLRVNEELD